MSDPDRELTDEEIANAFEAWMRDPEAVAALEADLASLEAANPALAEQGRRVEEAVREWLEGQK